MQPTNEQMRGITGRRRNQTKLQIHTHTILELTLLCCQEEIMIIKQHAKQSGNKVNLAKKHTVNTARASGDVYTHSLVTIIITENIGKLTL